MSGWMNRKTPGWFPGLHDPGAVKCVCGHPRHAHNEAAAWKPSQGNFCLHELCACQAFVQAPVTAKGTILHRYAKAGVGKRVGNHLYLHGSYVSDELLTSLGAPHATWKRALAVFDESKKWEAWWFNCVRIDLKTWGIRFDQAPAFDQEREPAVCKWFAVSASGKAQRGHSDAIWHHRWMWVKDDYRGFSVKESIAWSARYSPLIAGAPLGTHEGFSKQLAAAGLA